MPITAAPISVRKERVTFVVWRKMNDTARCFCWKSRFCDEVGLPES